MTTVTNTETLEEIAERLVYEGMNFHPDVPLTRPYRAFAAAIADALRNEREACARICDNAEPPDYEHGLMESGWEDCKIHLAATIRRE